jgi:peptidoglycan biosynthesis protein MviN/MurJ (putative lipid II flippase)
MISTLTVKVKLTTRALTSKVIVRPTEAIEVAANSKLQVLLPIEVLPQVTHLLTQLSNLDNKPIGFPVNISLKLSVISPAATWITSGAAVILFAAASLPKCAKISQGQNRAGWLVESNSLSNNSLAKASTLMAAGTIFSRITGLIRNLLLVALLGTTLLGDTYNVANTMPNILYNLLVGGALTAVFVPQIVRSLRDSDGGNAFISRLFTATVLFLLTLTLLGILLAPQIVNIYAPKFNGLPEFDVTVLFMRYCLPQIFFLGLFALLGQIANAKGRFGPMMWAPVINNLIVIALFGWYLQNHDQLSIGNITTHDIYWLGAGTSVGYLAQAAILLPVVYRSGVKLSFKFDLKNAELFNSIKLAGWSFLYALISQLSYLVTIIIATSAAVKSAS